MLTSGIYISLLILIAFLIATGFLCHNLKKPQENFTQKTINNNNHNDSDKRVIAKFYETPVTNLEKIDSLYSPFVTRPRDTVALKYNGNCTNELYPSSVSKFGKGEMSSPCCPEIPGKYYGMRPILTPEVYQDAIQSIFDKIENGFTESKNSNTIEKAVTKLVHQNEFCNGESYSSVMKFIFDEINSYKDSIDFFKKYAKVDTWGGEQFAYLNEKVYMFTEQNPDKYSEQSQAKRARKTGNANTLYVVTFTLYNPLRSSSLDTTAAVVSFKGKFYITSIRFTTNTKIDPSRPMGQDIPSFKSGKIESNQDEGVSSTPNWLYGNTIENKTFNLKGFHDPNESNNIIIPGGIPEEYTEILEKCDQAYLMKPAGGAGDRFEGGYQPNNPELAGPVYPDFPDKSSKWKVNV